MGYSQNGEDDIVAGCFPPDFTGNLLEIGAWMPTEFSNSLLLIERGWDATLVEFSPLPANRLISHHEGNEHVRVIAAAVTPNERHIERFRITADALSEPETEGHTSQRWKDMRPGYSGGFYGHLWVPTLSIQKLCDQFYGDRQIDFASIDTEGSSVEIAIAMMRMDPGWRPKVLCVEHDNRDVELWQEAKKHGYRMVDKSAENLILAR